MTAPSMRRVLRPQASQQFRARISRSAASFVLLLASAQVVHAGVNVWTRSGPAAVRTLAIDPLSPQTLYAGTAQITEQEGNVGGVFKSVDGGQTWSPSSNGLHVEADYLRGDNYVTVIAIDPMAPATLYAADLGRVFKSTDAGSHWSELARVACDIAMLVIDPITSKTLYAVTTHAGILCKGGPGGTFKSLDYAETWSWLGPGSGLIAVDPATPTTLYAGSWGAALKSTDGGALWTLVELPVVSEGIILVSAIAIDPAAPDTVYVGTNYEGLFKSTDGADSWQGIGDELSDASINALVIDPFSPETLYAGTDLGVVKSVDSGHHWSPLATAPTGWRADVLVIDPQTPTTLYAGTLDGVYKIEQVPPACVGDCSSAAGVFVDDLVTLASIALGAIEPAACPNGLPLGGTVDVAVLVDAVNNALSGCVA